MACLSPRYPQSDLVDLVYTVMEIRGDDDESQQYLVSVYHFMPLDPSMALSKRRRAANAPHALYTTLTIVIVMLCWHQCPFSLESPTDHHSTL